MRTVFLVQPDEAEIARRMEKILVSLPEDGGILFASVSVIQDPLSREPRKVLYRVVIGCNRSRDSELISLVARTYLHQKMTDEYQLTIEVHRGIDGRSSGT